MKDEIDDGDYDPRDEFPKSIYDDVYFENYRKNFSEEEVTKLLKFPLLIDHSFHGILLKNESGKSIIRYEDTDTKIKVSNKSKLCSILNGNGHTEKLGVKNIVFTPDVRNGIINANKVPMFMILGDSTIKGICGVNIQEEEAYYIKDALIWMFVKRLNESVTR